MLECGSHGLRGDRIAAGRAQAAMMQMNKINIAELEAAFNAN
jgi:hypothetical protein